LINAKRLSYEKAFCIIKEQMYKCNKLERLNFNRDLKIREGLNDVLKSLTAIWREAQTTAEQAGEDKKRCNHCLWPKNVIL
jgi:hypothetical protein